MTFWFELLEWLSNRGARKFIIALDDKTIPSKLTQQVDQLLNQINGSVTLMTSKSTETVDDSIDLIVEANSLAPLEAIFFASFVCMLAPKRSTFEGAPCIY